MSHTSIYGLFSHGFSFQSQSMRIMDEAVEDGAGEGFVADGGIPLVDGRLVDRHR